MAKNIYELLAAVHRRRIWADPPSTSDPVDDSPLLPRGGQDSTAGEARQSHALATTAAGMRILADNLLTRRCASVVGMAELISRGIP